MTTHTPADWAAFLLLGTGVYAAGAAVVLLIADADLADFDPRPVVRRVVESGRVDPLLIAVPAVKADARAAVQAVKATPREAALWLAALLMLLSLTAPEATR